MKIRIDLLFLTITIVLSACATENLKSGTNSSTELRDLFDSYRNSYLELNPLQAMFEGDYRFNHILGDYISPEYLVRSEQLEREYLQKLQAIDYQVLDDEDKLSYDIFKHSRTISLENYSGGYARLDALMPVTQFSSLPNFLAILGSGGSAQPFNTVEDYENWIKRAGEFPAWVEQAITNMQAGIDAGIVLPRVITEKILPQLQAHVLEDVGESVFYGPIRNMPESIDKVDAERLSVNLENTIRAAIIPAYRRLYTYLAEDYLPRTRATVGIGALPGGKEWYTYLARMNTTTLLTPEAIHAIGKAEAERIYEEMLAVKDQVGFDGDLPAFFSHMKTDPRFQYPSEEALLTAYRNLKDKIEKRIPDLFSLTPKAEMVIKPMESFRAASSASAEYMSPAPDGTRPGVFYLNTWDLPARLTWNRESLFVHEAVPGHHFQISIAQEQEHLPSFRRFDGPTAYVEGWGLYAESLGPELGLYTDPYQRMGALTMEIWRANRLVVDTGMHYLGWTREQAIAWMMSNSPMTEAEVIAEVDRYIAIPGQALAYKIGQMKLIELRRKSTQLLGDLFDIREFHRVVLEDGAMPLDLLEQKVNSWINK